MAGGRPDLEGADGPLTEDRVLLTRFSDDLGDRLATGYVPEGGIAGGRPALQRLGEPRGRDRRDDDSGSAPLRPHAAGAMSLPIVTFGG